MVIDDEVDEEIPQHEPASSSWEVPRQTERFWMPEDVQIPMPSQSNSQVKPRGPKPVVGPSRKEWLDHQKLHVPFQNWCKYCVMGRGKERPHRQVPADQVGPIPLIELDASYIKVKEDEQVKQVLVGVHVQSQYGMMAQLLGKAAKMSEHRGLS